MSNKPKKGEIVWQKCFGIVLLLLIGFAVGILLGDYLYNSKLMSDTQPTEIRILGFVGIIAAMYIGIFLQMIIHEAGHLIFGLISGYEFSSFRISSLMWLNEGGKIKFRRLSIAGTGGQCLMTPPDTKDGKFPVVLYNLGGVILNIIAGAIFLTLSFIVPENGFWALCFRILSFIGFIIAVMNGVPMRMGTVDNDGYNVLALRKSTEARQALWLQLKINGEVAKGVRLKLMPDEWFTVPSDKEMENSMVAAIGVFACNRLMDAEKFAEADALMEHLLEIESGMIGLHRNLMVCDRIYLELIGENRREVIEKMLTKEQRSFMKSMKNFPSVIRTEYAYARLSQEDTKRAESIKAAFERCARSHPYQSDIDSERSLVELVDKIDKIAV